jgi:hypothetical protein
MNTDRKDGSRYSTCPPEYHPDVSGYHLGIVWECAYLYLFSMGTDEVKSIERSKVRSPIPWIYGVFYTMYYWKILTVVLEWKSDVDKHHCCQHLSCEY